MLIIVTVLVGVTAEFLVSSINGLVESNPSLSAEWVGLILLPIVGNAAEHFTAVSVSVKDKLDLSISVAVCCISHFDNPVLNMHHTWATAATGKVSLTDRSALLSKSRYL